MVTIKQQLLLLILLLFLGSSAQQESGRIQGKVTDLESKQPLEGATVWLEIKGEKYSPYGAATDRQGGFHIKNISPGVYTLRCQCIGYHADSIGPVVIGGNSVQYFTFELDPHWGYTAEDARRDLDSGKVRLIFNAWPIYSSAQGELAKKYGFELDFTGCMPSDVERYNSVIIEYLKQRNGQNWYENFEREWSSLYAIDSAQATLPEAAQRVLTSRLTVQWKPANQYFYKCNLNGDSLPDYAFMVTVGEDPCLVEYYVALIAEDQSYAFHVLAARPSSMGSAGITEYVLRHKGEKVPNYEDYNYEKDEPTWFELSTDAIEFVPSAGCCAVVNVFRGSVFNMITSSD